MELAYSQMNKDTPPTSDVMTGPVLNLMVGLQPLVGLLADAIEFSIKQFFSLCRFSRC